jgi:chemotaxis protein methyltransferase CheR
MKATNNISEANLVRLADAIEQHLGLDFDRSQLSDVATVADDRMRAVGCADIGEYLNLLKGGHGMEMELRALSARLTNGESYFFRSVGQLHTFSEIVLPELLRRDQYGPIKILSAGCSTGEEPFTLAMMMLDRYPAARFEILGVDINPKAIIKARLGRFPKWSMRATPIASREQWFRGERGEFVLDDRVRAMVSFRELNMAVDDRLFWQRASFDVIFCRNVVMYLSARVLRALVARFAYALRPGGYLFTSHAEPLRGVSDSFEVEHCRGSFYYRQRISKEARRVTAAKSSPADLPLSPLPSLSPQPEQTHIADCNPETRSAITATNALIELERFADALALLEALSPEHRKHPEILFSMTKLLIDLGNLDRASELSLALVASDDLNAAAHYLMALCHELCARRQAAIASYRVGIFLDRRFAMPHLRLGMMFRREGDLIGARRELENAAGLMANEDPARLLLFSGGFSRHTLLELCDSELRLCGESR